MNLGTTFDIKEFTVHDGPGIRLTVFMKGCPLRCIWCHNPEGLSFEPQKNNLTGKIVGKKWSPEELALHISKFKDAFDISGGGVTFSGGEPTAQADFIIETASRLPGIHKTLDTSGYCDSQVFQKLLGVFDLIYFDLKIADAAMHEQYTGVSNKLILQNFELLGHSDTPYHVRVPQIPGITDARENLDGICDVIENQKNKPLNVDLLPYNILAGGKYGSYGLTYALKELEVLS